MKVCIDIEANSLNNPTKIWLVVCKDLDTGEKYVFREPTQDTKVHDRLRDFATKVTLWVGHNILEYDLPCLARLVGIALPDASKVLDTLILSRLIDYSRSDAKTLRSVVGTKSTTDHSSPSLPVRPSTDDAAAVHPVGVRPAGELPGEAGPVRPSKRGHSIESYGEEFGIPKGDFSDFTKYSEEMEVYCVRDVEIACRIYLKFLPAIDDPKWRSSILLEHQFQVVVNDLHRNGFYFDRLKGDKLLAKVSQDLADLDEEIGKVFQPREVLVREFTPRLTKFGTISRTSVPRSLWANIPEYEAGKTQRHTRLEPFNAASHKQIIQVLTEARWSPQDKTQSHIDCERELNRLKYSKNKDRSEESRLITKLELLKKSGWKINETNLSSLPPDAPAPARLLAKRILLESRRRTLVEWLGLVQEDGRIHGRFVGIGAWTHRMAHQRPNTANIPNEFDINGKVKLLGKELRSLWRAPKNRLLVGVDAEGIQLRIFAHLIDDKEFTDALVKGKKSDKSDPHSLNQKILGSVCATRAAAKRFIYALLLGAGMWKLSQILECSESEAKEALSRLLRRYTGWATLKEVGIPRDARRGYFIGLDGRKVMVPGETVSERSHLMMSGYLQNGEAIVMKRATLKWTKEIVDVAGTDGLPIFQGKDGPTVLRPTFIVRPLIVNLVHDEWQTEAGNNQEQAILLAECQSRALRQVGEELGLKCPLAGSYYNDDHQDWTIGTTWYATH